MNQTWTLSERLAIRSARKTLAMMEADKVLGMIEKSVGLSVNSPPNGKIPRVPYERQYRVEPVKEVSVTDTSSSAWRTAYISTLLEKDGVKLALRIAETTTAITERLNGLIEIGRPEHEAIEIARQRLLSLKAQQVEAIVGETLGP